MKTTDIRNAGVASRALAEHVSTFGHCELPPVLLDCAALHVLDTIGVAIAGSTTPHAADVARGLDDFGEGGDYTIFTSSRKRSMSDAILLNGTMAHAIDFDDSHKYVHPGCTVIPVALSFAERYKASGLLFLRSVIQRMNHNPAVIVRHILSLEFVNQHRCHRSALPLSLQFLMTGRKQIRRGDLCREH